MFYHLLKWDANLTPFLKERNIIRGKHETRSNVYVMKTLPLLKENPAWNKSLREISVLDSTMGVLCDRVSNRN